jgi:acyl-CoA synthetase (AMP-forming)/AMP-acid ligase II
LSPEGYLYLKDRIKDMQRPVAELSAGEVIAYARANLAGFKCPTSVEFIGELPRNPAGQVLKRVLRRNAELQLRADGFADAGVLQ